MEQLWGHLSVTEEIDPVPVSSNTASLLSAVINKISINTLGFSWLCLSGKILKFLNVYTCESNQTEEKLSVWTSSGCSCSLGSHITCNNADNHSEELGCNSSDGIQRQPPPLMGGFVICEVYFLWLQHFCSISAALIAVRIAWSRDNSGGQRDVPCP